MVHRFPCLAVFVFYCCFTIPFGAGAKQPNFVIILADDLGYGDLGCYGHPTIRTPNLDRMATEGVKLTDFYVAACVCTPSRAALLTGRLPVRSGMAGSEQRRVLYGNSTNGLPQTEITLARLLKQRNYATACIGKWHLGHHHPYLPNDHGFDFYFGLPYSNDMDRIPVARTADTKDPDSRYEDFNVPLLENDQILERPAVQPTLTRRYTEQAIRFLRENRKKPFFLYFPHTFPHVPLFASDQFKGKSRRGIYGDAVEELDWSVGQILDTLRREKLDRNTLVFFTSDNGPWLVKEQAGGSPGLLREGKGSTWEGGMRVPGIAWWPGKILPGTVRNDTASTLDFLPTLAALANLPVPSDRVLDGVDMSPILFGTSPGKRNTMFYYRGAELYAVRKGTFKAHFVTRDGYTKTPAATQESPLLFNLGQDPSERFNIANSYPGIVADLRAEAERHRMSIQPAEPRY